MVSVVIIAFNSASTLERCIQSVADFASEIIIFDMGSSDETVAIARRNNAKVEQIQYKTIVEHVRNESIAKATHEWVLVLDPDEELPAELKHELNNIISGNHIDIVKIPRKNIIFGQWIKHSGWWPDYQIRFFKRGKVIWSDQIHSVPKTWGEILTMPQEEKFALNHHNYNSIDDYLTRLMRYTSQEAHQILSSHEPFHWHSIMEQPSKEFIRRFFVWEGYKDGFHGLALALLQSFSVLIVWLKVWEQKKFITQPTDTALNIFYKYTVRNFSELLYWYGNTSKNLAHKIKRKIFTFLFS